MKPVVVLSNAHEQCVTFFWSDSPEYYVGYRLIEHQPQTLATSLVGIDDLPACTLGQMPNVESQPLSTAQSRLPNENWMTGYLEPNPADPIQLSFRANSHSGAWGVASTTMGHRNASGCSGQRMMVSGCG
jgi:hypothetical protein